MAVPPPPTRQSDQDDQSFKSELAKHSNLVEKIRVKYVVQKMKTHNNRYPLVACEILSSKLGISFILPQIVMDKESVLYSDISKLRMGFIVRIMEVILQAPSLNQVQFVNKLVNQMIEICKKYIFS